MKIALSFIFSGLLTLGLFITSPSVFAKDLTDREITQWIKAWPQLQAWGNKHKKEMTQLDQKFNTDDQSKIGEWFKNITPALKSSGYYDEYSAMLKKSGFSSVEQWASISNRILIAMISASMQKQDPAVMAKMKASMAQIDASSMPPEQKQMMIQMMQQGQAMFKTMNNAPAADVAVVSKHLPALSKILD